MISFDNFRPLDLTDEQIYKLLEYTALNLCKDAEVHQWWNEAGYIITDGEYLLGPNNKDYVRWLNIIWWHLVDISANDKYLIYLDSALSEREIAENRLKFPIKGLVLKDIKKYLSLKEKS